jgi:hypothetical protein
MRREKPTLAQRFHEAQLALAEAQRTYDATRHAYFTERVQRVRAGEAVEPLAVIDGLGYEDQLRREGIARSNGEADRFAEPALRDLNSEPLSAA